MNKIFTLFCIVVLLCSCGGGKSRIQVNGMQSTVRGILSGNKIELQNGTTVVLLGIKDSENGKKYLEQHVKGKKVTVIADSRHQQYIDSYLTTIFAYVRVVGESGCVQNKMLQTRCTTVNTTLQCDSLLSFSDAIKMKTHPIMSSAELRTTMLPATFLIDTESGSGTGFFINDKGLALTNNHVWDGTEQAMVYMLKDNGEFDGSNGRPISRMITTYQDDNIDFTIFIVQLDNNEKSSYLPLIEQKATLGEQVAKLGCGMGDGANFNVGVLSQYNEGYITHSINTNGGDSGSPICNMRGEVVGIHVASRVDTKRKEIARGISFATDALLIREVLDNLHIEYGR